MNLKDKVFGRLTVIGEGTRPKYVLCKCECGREIEVRATSLTKKFQPTRSCGCIQREAAHKVGSSNVVSNSAERIATNMKYHTNFQVIETAKPPKNNNSGCKGVCWDVEKQMWYTYLNVHGKRIFLGRYKKLDEAIRVRKAAEEKYFTPLIERKDIEKKEEANNAD